MVMVKKEDKIKEALEACKHRVTDLRGDDEQGHPADRPELRVYPDYDEDHGGPIVSVSIGPGFAAQQRWLTLTPEEALKIAHDILDTAEAATAICKAVS